MMSAESGSEVSERVCVTGVVPRQRGETGTAPLSHTHPLTLHHNTHV